MSTEEALEAITDVGVFEKLVTAILRVADPIYSRLVHVGVNAKGKTVKAPVDGLVPPGSSQKIAATAYTTTARERLRAKWLTSSDGDVPKGITELNIARANNPSQPAVLVLATNRSPDIDLINEVGEQCRAAGIELDLWERSRLSGFLDHNAEGQWLRQEFLGMKAQRLSPELLMTLAEASYAEYAKRVPKSSSLNARHDEQCLSARALTTGLTILAAPSGFGKTAIALRVMDAWLRQKRPALWIPENVLDEETSLSSAMQRVLENLHGTALEGAVLHLTASAPLLVVVDDVARTREPGRALEKLVAWNPQGQRGDQEKGNGNIHLLAPSWPEFILDARQDFAEVLAPHIIEMQPLDLAEALSVYRSRTADTDSTDDEALHIVERLGRDPLLIALHHRDNPDETPEEVVRSWITHELTRISKQTGTPVWRLKAALLTLAQGMLRARQMTPSANAVEEFFIDRQAQYDDLCAIIRVTNVLHWERVSSEERLNFRHDRIRDALLADAMNEFIDLEPIDGAIADPYYTGHVSEVIVRRRFDQRSLDIAGALSPLALFAALRRVGRARTPAPSSLVASICDVLRQQKVNRTLPDMFFWMAARLLAETDALDVEAICALFPAKGYWVEEALVRNGRVDIAVDYMRHHELGTIYPARDRLIRHAMSKHPDFILKVAELLEAAHLDSKVRIRLLLLAGFCGHPELGSAVENCLTQAPLQRPEEVESAMWAVTQCCRDNLERCINLVLDSFAALSPDLPDNAYRSERSAALLDHGGRRIAHDLQKDAVLVIIHQCKQRPDIEKELKRFLYRVDDPLSLCYWVRQRSRQMRADKEAGRTTWDVSASSDEWKRDLKYGRMMSAASRQALWNIWHNLAEPDEDRLIAFDLWRAQVSVTDRDALKVVATSGELGERVLQARVSLGDKSAFPEFLAHIEASTQDRLSYWWQFARGVMDAELAQGVDCCLSRPRDEIHSHLGWPLPELLMELSPDLAEPILIKHWETLQSIPKFFQAALFINTPATRKLAADAFGKAVERSVMLEHVLIHFGVCMSGRSHRVTLGHFKALEPYLDYLSESELVSLWHECNDRRWFDWRREHVDWRVSEVDDERLRFDVPSREALLYKLCTTRQFIWPEWVEWSFLDLGYSHDEAFAIITQWAKKWGTDRAIEIVAALFFNEGNRSQLPCFDRLVAGRRDYAMLQAHVHFGVKYRTLQ